MTLLKTLIVAGSVALLGTSSANAQASLGLTGLAGAAAVVGTVVVVGAIVATVADDDDAAATTTTN